MKNPIFCNCEFFEQEEILSIPLLWLVLSAWWHFYSNMRLLWPLLEGLWPTWHTLAFCTMEESHLWKSISILLHSYLKIFCCLKMKSVENILGYIREQFYRFSRGGKPWKNIWNCSRKYLKMEKLFKNCVNQLFFYFFVLQVQRTFLELLHYYYNFLWREKTGRLLGSTPNKV